MKGLKKCILWVTVVLFVGLGIVCGEPRRDSNRDAPVGGGKVGSPGVNSGEMRAQNNEKIEGNGRKIEENRQKMGQKRQKIREKTPENIPEKIPEKKTEKIPEKIPENIAKNNLKKEPKKTTSPKTTPYEIEDIIQFAKDLYLHISTNSDYLLGSICISFLVLLLCILLLPLTILFQFNRASFAKGDEAAPMRSPEEAKNIRAEHVKGEIKSEVLANKGNISKRGQTANAVKKNHARKDESPMNPNNSPKKTNTKKNEKNQTNSNEQIKPRNDKNTPKNDKNTPKNDKNTPKNDKNTPKNDKNTPKNDKNTPKNDKNTPKKDKNTPKNDKNTPKNGINQTTVFEPQPYDISLVKDEQNENNKKKISPTSRPHSRFGRVIKNPQLYPGLVSSNRRSMIIDLTAED